MAKRKLTQKQLDALAKGRKKLAQKRKTKSKLADEVSATTIIPAATVDKVEDVKTDLNDKIPVAKGATLYTAKGVNGKEVLKNMKGGRKTPTYATTSAQTRTPRRKSTRKAGDVVVKRDKGFAGNVKQNMTKQFAETVGLAAVGATSYVLIPTLLQKMSGQDLSGWKGFGIGLGSAVLLGLGMNKPEVAIGALAASGTHLLYSKGAQSVKNLTGVPLYRMAEEGKEEQLKDLPASIDSEDDAVFYPYEETLPALPSALNDSPELPPNAEWVTLPNGKRVFGFKAKDETLADLPKATDELTPSHHVETKVVQAVRPDKPKFTGPAIFAKPKTDLAEIAKNKMQKLQETQNQSVSIYEKINAKPPKSRGLCFGY